MSAEKVMRLLSVLLIATSGFAQTQTTGRIAGTVKDQQGALIQSASVTVTSAATIEERKVTTDHSGSYSISFLLPGTYRVTFDAAGFKTTIYPSVRVSLTETTRVDVVLPIAETVDNPVVVAESPLTQSNGPQLGRAIASRTIAELPLATRNFTQLLGLSPGTATALPNNTRIGRNTQEVSVSGARLTQNNYQINGIDANATIGGTRLADPAPETIAEFKVQTSLYDATFGGAGGGQIQVATKNGTADFHGALYEYLNNESLNANNPFLKAAGVRRPVLKRNTFGFTLGGPARRDKIFFFTSYQGIRERNGFSNSLSSNVLIAQGLTDDRSEATLLKTFRPAPPNGQPVRAINPTALALLNARSARGQFLIPTPQTDGRYSGSSASRSREDQFNANGDFYINSHNAMSLKLFFAQTPQRLELSGAINVPGYPVVEDIRNRLLSFQDVHTINSNVTNEVRFGFNLSRRDASTQQAITDSEVGIARMNADDFPGLPNISIASNAGGIVIGTGALQDVQSRTLVRTFADTLSYMLGQHFVRVGTEIRRYRSDFAAPIGLRGVMNFDSFQNFLLGRTSNTIFNNGIIERSLRSTDYNFFVQDDWKFSSHLTLNLGLRYELDLPPYDTLGRLATFDPTLYKPRPLVSQGLPVGPPLGGFVQAGNAIAHYDLPDVPNVSKRVLHSVDANNLAPRVGLAYVPFHSGRIVLRAGAGIFHSRSTLASASNSLFSPPFYLFAIRTNAPIENPFVTLPLQNQFPTLVPGFALAGLTFDRNIRTPFVEQYNASGQVLLANDSLLEIAYVGARGLNLLRQVGINQAQLASPGRPITNAATGAIITTNTPGNAQLRAPFQGVLTGLGSFGFVQDNSTGQSTYHSLQMSLTRRLSRGLQVLGSYTYSKSIDNGSGGTAVTGGASETGGILGDQTNNRANRGVSNFDRTHRLVVSFTLELPRPVFTRTSKMGRLLFSDWQVSGVVTAMSGSPVDIVDGNAATFYYGPNGGGARPNWVQGATRNSARSNIPSGYFFNPFAFQRPVVLSGQFIPSSMGTAIAGTTGTDLGNVGRNVLRGPSQNNIDVSMIKRFSSRESKNIECRAEFFNLLNKVNLANPISNLNAVVSSGGSLDPNTGRIINAGDFGRIISTSNNARMMQFAIKLNF